MKSIIIRCHTITICIMILLLLSFNGFAQNQTKKQYTSDLDSLWSRSTNIHKMTTDGKWVVLTEIFDYKENVVMLKHTSDTISFTLPESQWMYFSNDNRWFGCITANKELHLIDLVKHTKLAYQNVQSYKFATTSDYIAGLQKNDNEESLVLIHLNDMSLTNIKDVKKYLWHPQQNSLLIEKKQEHLNSVGLYDVDKETYQVLKENQNSIFKYLQWSASGNAVVFSEHLNNEHLLHYYTMYGNVITMDNAIIKKNFPQYELGSQAPYLSKDGKKILFYRQLKKDDSDKERAMEVWNSTDPWIYPKLKEYKERELVSLLTAWYPDIHQLIAIETKEKPTAAMDVNHKHAIVFNKLTYEPFYKEYPNVDIYTINSESGEEHLVVKNQYTGPGFVTMSPYGNYISYFKDKHWWVFNIKTSETINLTKGLKSAFEDTENDYAGDRMPFGNPGWTFNDEFMILYDQYDIWLMSPDGIYKERITKGKEEEIKYRISKNYRHDGHYFLTVNINFSSSPYDLDNGIALEMSNKFHNTGFAIWEKDNKIRNVLFENKKVDGLIISENFKDLIYRKQKFNEPHGIYNYNLKNNKETLLYQSNEELLTYDLGMAKQLKYNVDGVELIGTLLYPTNFNSEKKYPMIVYIYEKTSSKLNFFEPPSLYEYTGFNSFKFTTDEYFVLLPDIAYTLQDPGISALNCVTAAVNKALELGFIVKNKIGLIGHSFGGYESAFIATQTDMFAVVVAGAAVTNFTSHYHSVGWNSKKPEIWRYESQQWRMGDSYYNIKEAYFRNSPLHHVENVKTPLLLWTGKEDYQIHWSQSVEMFLALKRLKKESKLLMFENEPHALMKKDNQKKLSNEIKSWFDKYCKIKNE